MTAETAENTIWTFFDKARNRIIQNYFAKLSNSSACIVQHANSHVVNVISRFTPAAFLRQKKIQPRQPFCRDASSLRRPIISPGAINNIFGGLNVSTKFPLSKKRPQSSINRSTQTYAQVVTKHLVGHATATGWYLTALGQTTKQLNEFCWRLKQFVARKSCKISWVLLEHVSDDNSRWKLGKIRKRLLKQGGSQGWKMARWTTFYYRHSLTIAEHRAGPFRIRFFDGVLL